jgi:hypothetical protein
MSNMSDPAKLEPMVTAVDEVLKPVWERFPGSTILYIVMNDEGDTMVGQLGNVDQNGAVQLLIHCATSLMVD